MGHRTPGTVPISAYPGRSGPLFNRTCSQASTHPAVDVDGAKGAFGRITDRSGRDMQRSALFLMTGDPWTQTQ